MFFESQIGKYNFRFDDGNVIEISEIGDKNRTVIREIPVKELENEKQFHKEISFWFMENGHTL